MRDATRVKGVDLWCYATHSWGVGFVWYYDKYIIIHLILFTPIQLSS